MVIWPVALKSSDRTMEKRVELLLWLVVTDPKASRTVNIACIFSTAKSAPHPAEHPHRAGARWERARPPPTAAPGQPQGCRQALEELLCLAVPLPAPVPGHGDLGHQLGVGLASHTMRTHVPWQEGNAPTWQPLHPAPGHSSTLRKSSPTTLKSKPAF